MVYSFILSVPSKNHRRMRARRRVMELVMGSSPERDSFRPARAPALESGVPVAAAPVEQPPQTESDGDRRDDDEVDPLARRPVPDPLDDLLQQLERREGENDGAPARRSSCALLRP